MSKSEIERFLAGLDPVLGFESDPFAQKQLEILRSGMRIPQGTRIIASGSPDDPSAPIAQLWAGPPLDRAPTQREMEGLRPVGIWVDEMTDEYRGDVVRDPQQEYEAAEKAKTQREAIAEQKAAEAMDAAARAGLGRRGRIRAAQRAYAREMRR